MKTNILFLSAGICCVMMMGCNQPQKQETSASYGNDDIVWKASLSYCLTNDELQWQELKDGYDLDNCDMYNFKITEEKGNFHNLMKLFYDSSRSKTYTIYGADPANGMFPAFLVNQNEKQSLFPDSVWNNEHTKLVSVGNFFQYVKGFNLNHEFLFDSKAGVLKSTITDIDQEVNGPFSGPYMVCMAVLKFSDRTIDSLGTDQPGLKSEITWGREILMQIVDSGQGPKPSITEHWAKMDSLSRFTVNGISTTSTPTYPVCIKSNFNKKLGEWIVLAARTGQLPAFKYIDGDKIGEQLSPNELKNLNTIVDSAKDFNGVLKGYPHRVGAGDITGVELKEEIAFHQKSFNFESKITYAGILVAVKDKSTNKPVHNTSTVLYWVKLN